MRTEKRYAIFTRSLYLYIVVFVVVIFVTVALSYAISVNRLNKQAASANITVLKQINDTIDMKMKEIDNGAVNYLLQPDVNNFFDGKYADYSEKTLEYNHLQNKMFNFMTSNTNISSIYIYSEKTKTILSDSLLSEETLFYDSKWIQDYKTFQGLWKWMPTRLVENSIDKFGNSKQFITLIRPYPLNNSNGNYKGAMVINMDQAVLQDILKKAKGNSENYYFIIDKKGNVISQDDSEKNESWNKEPLFKSILSEHDAGILNQKVNGSNSEVFYITSDYTGWKYISVVPYLDADGSIITIRNVFIAITLLMLLLGAGGIIFVFRLSNKPIDQFIKSVAKNVMTYDKSGNIARNLGNLDEIEKTLGNVMVTHEMMRNQVRESIPVIKWKLFTGLLTASIKDMSEVQSNLNIIGQKLNQKGFIVMVADIDEKKIIEQQNEKDELGLYLFALGNISEELINQEELGVVIQTGDNKLVMLISFEDEDEKVNQIRAMALAETVQHYMGLYFKLTVTIGIGNQVSSLLDIHLSYLEGMEALKYRVVMGKNSVISYEDIRIHDDEKEVYRISLIIDSVKGAVKSADLGDAQKQIARMFNEVVKKNISPDMIRQLSIQLIMHSIRGVMDTGTDLESILKGEEINVYEALNQFESVAQMKDYVETLISGFITEINEKRNLKSSNEIIDRVLKYIQENEMKENLSLNIIADEFNVSVPYLSKLFKESTEMNFTDYIIEMRIKKAKKLLSTTAFKVSEIAETLGYTNAHGFIKIFKKYSGKTPGEFRAESNK